MTLNIAIVARALDFIWMSYRGPHMFTGSLKEDSHQKFSHLTILGNN